MNYQEYIDLGFNRIDMDDEVEYRRTGYRGFALEKDINSQMSICVSSGELDNPKLYIAKRDIDTNHILPITDECVFDLLLSNE